MTVASTWSTFPLGKLLTLAQYGLSVRGGRLGPTPILRMNCQDRGRVVFRDLQYVNLDPKTLADYRLEDGDLLFNRTNSYELVGRTALFRGEREAVFASYLVRLKVDKQQIDPDFLTYYLNWSATQRRLKGFASRGVSQSNISASKLRGLDVRLPPIPEQRAIGAMLSKIQDAIDVQTSLVATLKELKGATMAKVFREGLRNESLKQTEIGEIPESWDLVELSDAVHIVEGQVDPRNEPFASMIHVGPDSIEASTGHLLSCVAASELNLISGKYQFRVGDTIYSKIRPYLVKAWFALFPGICSADMYPLRAKEGFAGSFVASYLLVDMFTRQATSQQSRTGIPKVNREQLSRCLVGKPSIEEQRGIAEIHASLLAGYEDAVRHRALLVEVFEATLEELMTGDTSIGPATASDGQ